MLTRIPLLLFCLLPGVLLAQTFDFEKLNNPSGFFYNQYIGEIEDLAYLSYVDDFFEGRLFSFDGDNLTEIPAPDDLTYSYLAGQNGEDYFLVYNDFNFENAVVLLNKNGLELLFDIDPNEFFDDFAFQLNGVNYFSIFDFNFNAILRYYDGSQLQNVVLPANNAFGDYLGKVNGVTYVSLQDNLGNTGIYSFDGTAFFSVNMPFPVSFINPLTTIDGGLYLTLFDLNFNSSLYFFDGLILTQIPIAAGYTDFGNFVGKIKDRIFFSHTDSNFEETLFELETGNNWIEFPNPPGFSYRFNPGVLEADEALYPAYADAGFVGYMAVFDGTTLDIIDNPPGGEYNTYYRDFKKGHLIAYYDNNFTNRLYFFDNTTLKIVSNPTGFNFDNYEFQYGLHLYCRFADANFDASLFSLALNTLPSSADNTINTERETPYTFILSDFAFSDEDVDDSFEEIQIVTLPTKGILHVSGAQVSPGQAIPVADLTMLNYVPLDDGVGQPYDSFTFKVSDGLSLSEETYTLFVNINPTVNTHNLELANHLTIFPNPASDRVTIRLENYEAFKALDLSLFAANGELLESRKVNEHSEVFELNHLPTGFYQLTIQNENVNLSRALMIVR